MPLTADEVWRTYDAIEARLTAALSERMLDLAGLCEGMRVLDLASGRGEPAIRAAHRVGPRGQVVGVELSEAIAQLARERSVREGLTNFELRVGNAERLEALPAAAFDVATCRWGLMSLTSPLSALEGARRALVAGGVLVAALWAEPDRVPYYTLPRQLLQRYRPLPPIDLNAPGTFYYADPARFVRDLTQAGFGVAQIEELEVPVMEASSSAEVVAWARAFGLARLLEGLPERDQRAWEADLTEALERRRTPTGIALGGVTRVVVARALS